MIDLARRRRPASAAPSGRARRRPSARAPRRCSAGARPSRARIAGVSTLLSSKTKASLDVRLLDRRLADDRTAAPGCNGRRTARRARAASAPLSSAGKLTEAVLAATRAGRRLRRPRSSARSWRGPSGLRIAMWPSCWKLCERAFRRVDRDMGEVRAAEALELRVEIGEVAALQQRIVGEVDAGHDVLRAERDLLGLGEEIVDACGRAPGGRRCGSAPAPPG